MQVPHDDCNLLGSRQKKQKLHAGLPKHAGGSLGWRLGPGMPKDVVRTLLNNCYFSLNRSESITFSAID